MNPAQRTMIIKDGEVSQQLADGRLFYSYAGEGLWMLTAPGPPTDQATPPTLLPIEVGPRDGSNWHATPDGIYSVRLGARQVRFFDFTSHQTRDVIELPQPAAPHGLRISADGKSLYVATVTLDQSRVLIVAADSPAAQ